MRDTPRRPNPGDETESSGSPKASQDKTGQPGEAQSENKRQVNEPLRRPDRPRPVDPKDLQSLLDYRDERARAEARLVRAKHLRQDDRRRASVPEPDESPAAAPEASQERIGRRSGEAPDYKQPANEPLRRPGRRPTVDANDLQSLLDYRDERARAEARLLRAKDLGHDDRRRAPSEPTNEPPRRPGTIGTEASMGEPDSDVTGQAPRPTSGTTERTRSHRELHPASNVDVDDSGEANARSLAVHETNEQLPEAEQECAGPTVTDRAGADANAHAFDSADGGARRTVADRARDLHYDIAPELVAGLGFDPGHDRGALGDHFRPGLLDPHGEIARKESTEPKIAKKELAIIQYLIEERGALITILPESQIQGAKNPDTIVRWGPTDDGGTLELKTLASDKQSAIEQNLRRGSAQLAGRPDPQLLIDGRDVDTTEADAREALARRLRISPSTAPTVHFILDQGQWLTLPDGERRGS